MQTGILGTRVVGALLGTQAGRDVEVMNSFEVVVSNDDGQLRLDHAYFVTRRDQFRQVFPTFDFLGWYSVGQAPMPEDTALHKQFFEYNESPLFLQLDPSAPSSSSSDPPGAKDLPVAIYESVVEIVADKPEPVFVNTPYEIVTGEAERVAVEGVSKPEAGNEGGAHGNLLVTLSTQRNALSMLQSRVSLIVQYLQACLEGKARKDNETLRMIASLVGSLPGGTDIGGAEESAKEGGELKEEFLTEYNDVLLTTYLSALTKQLLSANELLDKQLLFVASSGSGGRGGSFEGERSGGRAGRRNVRAFG
ncbi:COP9 signalosome complex subunit 6 [Rhodotorula toruloides]|uniref:COP9 signalosome complex subunit 6 n=1 Tax=Rhodotorula toruloides TaxID=5286 RepID=A0A511KHI4_RHOTO|nr:COP9 signalosome complex subunit 6 [Rhodotorula toruloides]